MELYNLWTDIVGMYVGRTNGLGNFHHGSANRNTGEIVIDDEDTSLTGTFETYIPVNPEYTYAKTKDGRMYNLFFYDSNLQYIDYSRQNTNNLSWTVLDPFPANAAYIRFGTHQLTNNWGIAVFRIK